MQKCNLGKNQSIRDYCLTRKAKALLVRTLLAGRLLLFAVVHVPACALNGHVRRNGAGAAVVQEIGQRRRRAGHIKRRCRWLFAATGIVQRLMVIEGRIDGRRNVFRVVWSAEREREERK